MFEKDIVGVIEQVYAQMGKVKKNIVVACYNNDFSLESIDEIQRYSQVDDVFFATKEFEYNFVIDAFAPFLEIIFEMHRTYVGGNFYEFMEECGVYYLHRDMLLECYNTGVCKRKESVILDEVDYEKSKMTEGLALMLKRLAEIKPIFMIINRFQIASESTMKLVELLLDEPTCHIGIVIGMNESQLAKKDCPTLNNIIEKASDESLVYHMGSTGQHRKGMEGAVDIQEIETVYNKFSNGIELLDYGLMSKNLDTFETMLKNCELQVSEEWRVKFIILYVRACILSDNIRKALELIDVLTLSKLEGEEQQKWLDYNCAYYTAVCFMYLGRLNAGLRYVTVAKEIAESLKDEELEFEAEVLKVQLRMSGWHNIFFCLEDVYIDEALLENLMKRKYENNLAHIYIYAYDNGPEVVAKAYRSEELLRHFSKGVELAMEIGNEQLVYDAYQKNIMIASTNGMNEIALLYSVRAYEFMSKRNTLDRARVLGGIGYNLSALGHNELAESYYNRSIEALYELRLPQDIAENDYNLALNSIMMGDYAKAQQSLQRVVLAVTRLRMNSLRVCNMSKLYALLALVSALQNQRFNADRYLKNCRQFLNYAVEKTKITSEEVFKHDYSVLDDDMFLFNFATGLLCMQEDKDEEALEAFEKAETYLVKAEGNQFYVYSIYRKSRMKLFEKMNRTQLYEKEKSTLDKYMESAKLIKESTPLQILNGVLKGRNVGPCSVQPKEIDNLMKSVGVGIDYIRAHEQMEFLNTWQRIISSHRGDEKELVENVMRVFLNYFGNDKAAYVRFEDDKPVVFYNSTEVVIDDEMAGLLSDNMIQYQDGFVVSKISGNFNEHLDMISYFGTDDVCSFAAIPFFNGRKIESFFITYVMMKENWHNANSRYMLDEEDLKIYRLLWRELNDAVIKIQANRQIYEMNAMLEKSAVTDMLTGVYNRSGMYREIGKMHGQSAAIMFIDLDNFKPYNDTYGHDVGDIVLQGMSNLFCDVIGDKGFVSRFGGDEFIILLNTKDKKELEEIAKQIYSRIESSNGFVKEIQTRLNQNIEMDESKKIGCSIGISITDSLSEQSADEMLRQADELLYTIKKGKKGTYAFI